MKRNACNPLDGIYLSDKRRDGNTTQIIDNIIQLLFKGETVLVKDHFDKSPSQILIKKVNKRLQFEHQQQTIIYNENENTIRLL